MAQHTATDDVDQLWYTWSTTGLDALVAGFRVRAASPGLTDLYGERMKQLDRYLRYSLPAGSDFLYTRPFDSHDRNLLPDDAPVCLAFIRTESGERALVQKVYTGKDGRGRPGAYFAHMLANLPRDFSVRDAIRFWRSPFWRTSDVSEYTRGTDLSPALLEWHGNAPVGVRDDGGLSDGQRVPRIYFEDTQALTRQFKGVDFNSTRVYEHLCFLIRAYLLVQQELEDQEKKIEDLSQEIEKNRQEISTSSRWRGETRRLKDNLDENEAKLELMRRREPRRIFIAAPPDEVAYLIAGLTRLLPRQFLRDFTFSTYESDVLTKLSLDIVGTCPPAVLLDRQSTAPYTLPAACEQRGYVLNTYRDELPNLPTITTLGYMGPPVMDYVESYARFAIEQLQSVAQEGEQKKIQEFTFNMLEPIEEVDYLFKELGDDPFNSTNEAAHISRLDMLNSRYPAENEASLSTTPAESKPEKLSVSDFLDRYYTEIYRKQLSLPEIADILSNPATALLKLKNTRFREQIFSRKYRDVAPEREDAETREEHLSWLSHTFPTLVADLRQWYPTDVNSSSEQGARPVTPLESLAAEAMKILLAAAQDSDQARFLALFVARVSFIERADIDAWSNLFASLAQNQPTRTLVETHWAVRVTLLKLATTMPGLENRDHADFLLNVQPVDFGKLLEYLHTLLPSGQDITATTWKYKAALIFLKNYAFSNSSIASKTTWQGQEVVRHLEDNFAHVEKLIKQLLASPPGTHKKSPYAQWRTTALDLLWLFINNEYYKPRLVALWLDDVKARGILPDISLDSLQLNPAQEEMILREYGPTFIQLNGGGSVVAPLFWQMMVRRSAQKMEILFALLEKQISLENFVALLGPHQFSHYQYFDAEDIHALLMRFSTYYMLGCERIGIPVRSLDHNQKLLPQYLRLYPQAPFWKEAVILLEQARHKGKMPLIYEWMSIAIEDLKQVHSKIQTKQVEDFLDALSTSDEYYNVLHQYGPAMLRIQPLAPRVLSDYKAINADTKLLYRLLDTYYGYSMTSSDYDIADQLVEATPFAGSEDTSEFVRHYAKNVPQLCYRLPFVRALCKQSGWRELQGYIPGWLLLDMEEQELEDIFADAPLAEVDHSLIENCGEVALRKYPTSRMLLELTRHYLKAFDVYVPQNNRGTKFIHFLSTIEKNSLPNGFKNLYELIQGWYGIQQFIAHPSLQHKPLYKAFKFIRAEDSRSSWIDPLAIALVTCLEHSGDLGSIISSLSMVDTNSVSLCLMSMAEYVKDYTKKADYTWWQHATILLEGALLPDLLGSIPRDVQEKIISDILQNSSKKFFSYVNAQAQLWLPEVQQRLLAVAPSYGFTPTHIPRSHRMLAKSTSRPARVEQTNTPQPVKSTELSILANSGIHQEPTPPSTLKDDAVEAPDTFRRSLRGWLIFPWLLLRLGILCRQSGTGPLVRFWWEHSDALMQGRRLTPRRWKQQLKFACDFYNARQKDESAIDQKLWALVEKKKQYRKDFTKRELERIAANSPEKSMPAKPTSSSEVSK